jgi:ribosome maturation factor RimP
MEGVDRLRQLDALISPMLEQMGYDLVRVVFQGQRRPTLQVMAERKDGRPMTVEDCAGISRSLSALLDVEDPIDSAYVLEVSSPGIDRPLTRVKDFATWAGFDVRIETDQPVEGRKRFRGRLLGLDGEDSAVVVLETGEAHIPLARIRSAKLVLTDDLIAAVTHENGQD